MNDLLSCNETFSLQPFEMGQTYDKFIEAMWRPRQLLTLRRPIFRQIPLSTYRKVAGKHGRLLYRALFNSTDDATARDAILEWLLHVAHEQAMWAPQGTMELFDDAFERGIISRVAWSAAARLCYLQWVAAKALPGERVRRFLDPISTGDPLGLMTDQERTHVNALPETVTLYRASLTSTVEEAAAGISWTSDPAYLAKHINEVDQVARCNAECEVTYSRERGWQHHGSSIQWAVKAQFPRSAIKVWVSPHESEYLVDYREVIAGSIEPIPTLQLYPCRASIEAAERYIAEFA